jgi:cysteinyl-tRNA synthetase
MSIRLYNTATHRKEIFTPLNEGEVGMYVCGVTVYDLCHIGHARSAIVFDVLVRYLRARGFEVTYVRNFTDVDDKIIARANEIGEDPKVIAEKYIEAFYEDMDKIGVLKADIEPRATEHIDGMIEMIETLIKKGYAYVEDGDVYYSVSALKEYGKLSGRRLEDMHAGSRIAVDERKRHPMDFALWKSAKPNEPQWPSPWGPGRPGWHMECSVMSNHYLGPTFDIHGGGQDLLFPHHENERAQSIAANEAEFARYWIHNGFVTVDSEKMSKSLGNFLTIRDALALYHPEVLRLFLLSKHYRSPLDFAKDAVLDAQSGLVRMYRALERLDNEIGAAPTDPSGPTNGLLAGEQDDPFLGGVVAAMDDDLNTAGAVGLLFERVKEINKLLDTGHGEDGSAHVERLRRERRHLFLAARVLGLLGEEPAEFFQKISTSPVRMDDDEIESLIRQRSAARADRDWAQADAIREQLQERGVVLEDGPKGTTWRFDV